MHDDEALQLRAVALRNASSIVVARQRAQQELVRAKEELERKSEELAHYLARLKATLEATTDGILVLDSGSRLTDYNENLLRMWHMKASLVETTGERLLDWMSSQLADPEADRRRLSEIVAASTADTFDVIELADGRVFERTSRIQLVDDTTTGRVWSFRDITATRRAEEQLRNEALAAQHLSAERQQLLESERAARASAENLSRMKDEFLTNLSHELRTPLNAILGWATMLQRGHRRDAHLQKGIETIERNARAQKQLIDDLLDVSRIISGKLRLAVQLLHPVSVVEAALDTVQPAANAKGIPIERMLDGAAGPVGGDPERLQQVMWNLLSNAVKFTPAGGKVQVRLERVGPHVEISVTDTGVGVAPEFLPHMFDRLRQGDSSSTKRYAGLGLGLSIVKHLVEMHGGSARAESAGVGLGTRVTIQLPLAADRAALDDAALSIRESAASHATELIVMDLSGIHVLVVDHEADTRALMQRVFESCNARVSSAGSIDEALHLLGREQPDVLVSEVGASGVDGYELLRRVRALDLPGQAMLRGLKRIPAVALSAFARSEDRTRALRAGFLIHLAKPIEPSELVATVATVCGRSEA